MKKLYLANLNPKKHNFDFCNAGFDLSVLDVKSSDFLLDYGDGGTQKPVVFYGDQEIDRKSSYIHFLSKGESKSFTSVLIHFLKLEKYFFSNRPYEAHANQISKHVTLFDIAHAGISIPKTMVLAGSSINQHIDLIEDRMSYPLVLKGRGSEGSAIFLCKNRKSVFDAIRELEDKENRAKILSVQEVIDSCFDVRVLISFGRVVAAMKRESDEFKNNYALGGEVSKYELSNDDLVYVKKIMKEVDFDVYGIDLMYKDGSPCLIEIQHGPGLEGIRRANPELDIDSFLTSNILDELKKI